MQLHEHDNHPDFKCVLEARIREDLADTLRIVDGQGTDVTAEAPQEVLVNLQTDYFALIYATEFIALTLNECCYALWDLISGAVVYSSFNLWRPGEWYLTPESIDLAKKHMTGVSERTEERVLPATEKPT